MNTACLKQDRRELVQCPGEKHFWAPATPPSLHHEANGEKSLHKIGKSDSQLQSDLGLV